MYVGQILAYAIGLVRGHVWKVGIKGAFSKTPLFEKILYLILFLCLVFCKSYLCVFFYLTGLNINYAICIVPDHDTYESTIENDKDTDDWCEMEVRKSGNFNESSKLFTEINGGINFQIEHHLFPTVAHGHYEKLAPIVKSFCKKEKIPYSVKGSLWEVYKSYKKMLSYVKIESKEKN
jgi:linoleoyl-CoA desaturase